MYDDCHLGLFGLVANLRESDVGFADPAGDGVRLNGPCQHLAGLSSRKKTAENEPAVLCDDAAVIEHHVGVFRLDFYHTLRSVGSHDYVTSLSQRQRIYEFAGAAVVVGLVSFILNHFLLVGPGDGVAGNITREAVILAVHDVGLGPVL